MSVAFTVVELKCRDDCFADLFVLGERGPSKTYDQDRDYQETE